MHTHIEKSGHLNEAFCEGFLLEGFERIISFAKRNSMSTLFRPEDEVEAWWEYPSESGDQVVEWESPLVPDLSGMEKVTFVWSCVMGGRGKNGGPYPHYLFVNGKKLCRFQTPCEKNNQWSGKGWNLHFDPLEITLNGESHGLMYLTFSANRLQADKNMIFKVQGGRFAGKNYSFFMLTGYTDTLKYAKTLHQEGIEIVTNGVARMHIAIASNANEVEVFAAQELQRYVEKITGTRLKIRTHKSSLSRPGIVVGSLNNIKRLLGANASACVFDPNHDGIMIKTWKNNLLLTGTNSRSVLFAVYQLLTAKGYRWLEPGKRGEFVPSHSTLRVESTDYFFQPKYAIRTSRPTEDIYVYTEKDIYDQIDWMAKNGMNFFQFLIPPYERFKKVIVPEMKKRGMIINVGIHNFRSWLPKDLFAKHPEYFAMVGGKRISGGTVRCASSKEGLKIWAENAVKWVKNNPEVDEISISCDDGSKYCQCDECQKLKPIDQLQIFYNQAAKAIHRHFPEKRICILSYCGHYEPSSKIPTYNRNVYVLVDTLSSCQIHPLLNARCNITNSGVLYSDNTPDVRAEEQNRYVCLILKKWKKVLNEVAVFVNVMVHARLATPFPNLDALAVDLRYLHDIGISGFMPQADLPRWTSAAVNHYLIARLTWDPDINVPKMLNDYYHHALGPAAEYIQRYDRLIENTITTHHAPILKYMNRELINQCDKLLMQALDHAKSTFHQQAVRRVNTLFSYTKFLWELQETRKEILSVLKAGREQQAKAKREALKLKTRSFMKLLVARSHDNIFLLCDGVAKMIDQCVNNYSFVDESSKLKTSPSIYSFQSKERIERILKSRNTYQERLRTCNVK